MMSSPQAQQTHAHSSFPIPNPSPSPLILKLFSETDEPDAAAGSLLPDVAPIYPLRPLPKPIIEVIAPPANRLIDLIKAHYPAYEQRTPLPAHVRHAMQMVQYCHTDALGGHVERCPDGHLSRVFYNSCGHRMCPRCAGRQRRKWLRERRAKNLPVRHYHVVFTIPHAFNDLWRSNFRIMGNLLFHTATDAVRAFLTDPKWLGAEPGITVTLETWDDRLLFHPHLHCLVTGGGLTPDGTWRDVPNPRCFVAVKPLMWEFRKRFCQSVKDVLNQGKLTLPKDTSLRQWLNRVNRVNRRDWEVFIAKPPEDGGPTPDDILRYQAADVAGGPLSGDRLVASPAALSETQLAYLKAFPLSQSRLVEAPEGQVRFWWGAYDPATGRRERDRLETLPVAEFLSRYLQHLPPPYYQTVRHYGLYTSAPAKHKAYKRCCDLLADREPPSLPPASDDDAVEMTAPDTWMQRHTCPICGKPLMVSSYLPSSVTGHLIPRVPLGYVVALSSSPGGGHDP